MWELLRRRGLGSGQRFVLLGAEPDRPLELPGSRFGREAGQAAAKNPELDVSGLRAAGREVPWASRQVRGCHRLAPSSLRKAALPGGRPDESRVAGSCHTLVLPLTPQRGLRPVHLRRKTVVVAARYGGAVFRLRPLMLLLVVAAATPTAAVALTATDTRASAGSARVRSCGAVTLSGTSAVVRSYGTGRAAPLACPSARRILRRFIARGRPNGTQSGWTCHMTSVQGGGYPADHAWCDRGSREIQASADSYGE